MPLAIVTWRGGVRGEGDGRGGFAGLPSCLDGIVDVRACVYVCRYVYVRVIEQP